jgi:acetylornithine deacetylase
MREKTDKKLNEHKDRYLDFLRTLIAFDTSVINHGEDGQEGKAQSWLADYLRALNFEIDMFEPDNERICRYPGYNKGHRYDGRPNLAAVLKGTGGGRSLILNGHIDTMPSGDLSRWKYDPWTMTREDGKLFGLGTDDMKGGLAAMILACELVLECGFVPRGNIIIESVVDEEGGGNGTLACVDRGYAADGAIIAEGSLLEVYAANRGAWLAQTIVEGVPVHASLRGFGQNAIEKTVKIIQSLRELETKWITTRRHPLLGPSTINIGYIQGGVAASTVAESCTLRFDVEYYPSELDRFGERHLVDKDDIVREVEQWLTAMASGDEWLKDHPIKFEWYQDCSPFETDVHEPLVQTLADVVNEVSGKRVISGMSAGCDARHLTNIAKVPTVVCGPGTCHNAHVVNEFLAESQFFQAIAVYAHMIMKWTG